MDRRGVGAGAGDGAARHRQLIAALLLFVAACASNPKDEGPPIGVELALVDSPGSVVYFPGPVNLRFEVTLTNPTDQPVTLRRLDLRTLGGGSFFMRATGTTFHVAVPPHGTKTVTMSAWGASRGGMLAEDEPIQLQGTAYFNGPQGAFVRMINTRLSPR
jgi:hypothetical protein